MGINGYTPKIFMRKKSKEDYLQAALETAEWIDRYAVETPYGRVWQVHPPEQNGFHDIMIFNERCLYSGASGIGLFFLRLYQATGERRWLDEAEAAAAHLIATASGPEWYESVLNGKLEGILQVPGWAIGYSNGPIGEASFVMDLFEATGKEKYLAFVLKTADDLLEAAKGDAFGLHWSPQEDLVADGGFVIFLIMVYQMTGIKKYLDAACRAADYIAKDALDAPSGGKFWKLLDLRLIGFPEGTTFPNFSHGTAGTAWMFAVLYGETKNEKYLSLAKDGVAYLMHIAVGDETGMLIPYQDHPKTGPTFDRFYLSTCHGPAGTTLVFRKLYELTGEEIYRDWVIWLSRGVIRAGAPESYSWGYWNSMCQCCGSAGLLEHFINVYELTRQSEFLTYAVRTADKMLSDSSTLYEGLRTWYGAWTRTIPEKVVSYLGLYVGNAGCASALLSLYALEAKKTLTKLYEFRFVEAKSHGK